ncbi:MAG: NAD kinase [Bacteroidia bacterium]|nr:NAD kinase [Bacteroidia bacterium]
MKIAIYGKTTKNTNFTILGDFLYFLHSQQIDYVLHEEYASELRSQPFFKEHLGIIQNIFRDISDIQDIDFFYCIGGDGTLLNAVRFLKHFTVPVVGVNAGRLGFLTPIQQQAIEEVTVELLNNAWKLDERSLIELSSYPEIFADWNFGLNEITIHKAISNEMIVVHTFVNGEFLNSYWCDGLIVSTPTGSTAYNLACGGPLISPNSGTFVLTPIAPHSLTVRPIIVADSSVISFQIESRSGNALVAIDNRTEIVPAKIELAVRKSIHKLHLVRAGSRTFFSTLRSRLNWGLDPRN